jgi:hypothetical protein
VPGPGWNVWYGDRWGTDAGMSDDRLDDEEDRREQYDRYSDVGAEEVVDDAVEYFDDEKDDPNAADIPDDVPPPPNA